MLAQLQIGEIDGFVVMSVHDAPGSQDLNRRWLKTYANREDLCWHLEYLEMLSAGDVSALRNFPAEREIPALTGFVRDPKATLQSFIYLPVTPAN